MRLAIRGLHIVMSEQQAAHWCSIILNKIATSAADAAPSGSDSGDQVDAPIPIASTFLLEPVPPGPAAPATDRDRLSRYVITLRVYKVVQDRGVFHFRNHLEQVAEWADSLIVDIGLDADRTGSAWTAWNSDVPAPIDSIPRMPNELTLQPDDTSNTLIGTVRLPPAAQALPIFGGNASLRITVQDRAA